MFIRTLVLSAFVCCFFVSEGFAGKTTQTTSDSKKSKIKTTKSTKSYKKSRTLPKPFSPALLRSLTNSRVNLPILGSPSKTPLSLIKPLLSPFSQEKKAFSKSRQLIALKKAENGYVESPVARKVLLSAIKIPHFQSTPFKDRIVYRAPHLVNWDDKVLTKNNKNGWEWKTNLERALHGLSPIAYKGIAQYRPVNELDREPLQNIIESQKRYSIQLHHLTQRDSKENEPNGAENNPLIWLTTEGHRSSNAQIILEVGEDGEPKIVCNDLTKEEAKELCEFHQWISTNNMHFRLGYTLIDRIGFNDYRRDYWVFEGKTEEKRRASESKDPFASEEERKVSKSKAVKRLFSANLDESF